MFRIALFLLLVVFLVAIVLFLKTIHEKSEDEDTPTQDELDTIVSSWDTTERKN